MERQRALLAMRNKAALDRALAPPYRPAGEYEQRVCSQTSGRHDERSN